VAVGLYALGTYYYSTLPIKKYFMKKGMDLAQELAVLVSCNLP
jgi:hypothetical protein